MRNAYAFTRPVANAYLVRERDRKRFRELGLVLVAVGALGVCLLSYTWIHLEVLSTGYKIDKLETQLRELTRTERQLSLEAAYLASPQMIEERARRDLGLEPPALDRVIFWEELP